MNGRLDQLALRSADTDGKLSRRDVLGRGLLGVLALSGVGRVLAGEVAWGAATKCTSFKACLEQKEKLWTKIWRDCSNARAAHGCGGFCDYDCWDTYTEGIQHSQQYCYSECPPPKGGKKTKPPTQTRNSVPPPPPNEGIENAADMCANCVSVGGKCCYGSWAQLAEKGALCACAHQDYSCRVYGCDQ